VVRVMWVTPQVPQVPQVRVVGCGKRWWW